MMSLADIHARHAAELARRSGRIPAEKRAEVGYRCLCCKDTGSVDKWVIRRYKAVEGIYGDYDELVTGEVGYLCQRPGCTGNEVLVATEQGTKRLTRYSYGLEEMSADYCKWVHEQEVLRFRSQEQSADPRVMSNVLTLDIVNAIAKPMPAAAPVKVESRIDPQPRGAINPADIEIPDEIDGWKVGDMAMVGIDHLDKRDQGQIKRGDEMPIGVPGEILRFDVDRVAAMRGLTDYMIAMRFEGGRECRVGVDYLRKLP